MTSLGCLVLGAGLALGAPTGMVEGTNWRLDEPEHWAPHEVEVLHQLAADLPDGLRQPHGGLVLLRTGRLDARQELHEPGSYVQPGGRRGIIRVADENLLAATRAALADEDAAVDELASEILRRQVVSAVLHQADRRQGWSRDPVWRGLSDWSAAPMLRARERDPLAYFHAAGQQGPRADLVATSAHLFHRLELPWDEGQHPACRNRAKWRYVKDRISPPLVEPPCATLPEVGLDPERVAAVEIVLGQAAARSPASLAGHVGLGLVFQGEDGRERIEVYQLAADVGDVQPGNPLYALQGLSGGFRASISRETYSRTVLSYAVQNRAVYRLRLRLDAAQKLRLLERLDDLRQGWDRRYLFLTRNCTYLPRALLEWALGESLGLPELHGPDALLGELERRGLIEPVPAHTVAEFNLGARARVARELRQAEASRLLEQAGHRDPELGEVLAALEDRDAAQRGQAYRDLAGHAPHLIEENGDLGASLTRIFAWSTEIESARARARGEPSSEAMGALWVAMDELQRASSDQPVVVGSAEHTLLDELRAEQERRLRHRSPQRSHTPLRRQQLEGGMQLREGRWSPTLTYGSAFYRHRLGEVRRYAPAAGVDARLLDATFTLHGLAPAELATEVTLVGLRRILGQARFANPGFYLDLMSGERPWGGEPTWGLAPLDAGVLLQLWQHDQHRMHLGVSAGLKGRGVASRPWGRDADWLLEATVPLGIFGRIGSPAEPLTGLDLEGRWLALRSSTLPGGWDLRLAGQLRLGSLGGSDLALASTWRLHGHAGPWRLEEQGLSLGVWIERF